MGAERKRLDLLLTELGLFSSRSAARSAVMAGLVAVGGSRVDKPGTMVTCDAKITVSEMPRYVSRGGLKLEKALCCFGVDPGGRVAMDVGASTGGFTDCLLQAGAKRVYSIDVGYGQLDWRLRQDVRVVSLERTNIRYLDADRIAEPVDLAVVDVSFISLALIFPVLSKLGVSEIVALVKPQFEAGKGLVGKKGVVREASIHQDVLHKAFADAARSGYLPAGLTYSPLRGPQGNIEYLLHLKAGASLQQKVLDDSDCRKVVEEAHSELI
ncbi:MAG: TlyA family RNA methyltransferase [Dethiobacter sp.]|jgi:23S rRNA (cytidine1920-2'-O)/16S rRNA (cytidine1409-2'-O)-methyltransferase|nr:TlyA family RNA methyltransferase [Dethiobacter sp.]